jgi:hypothetical protein
MPQAIVRGCLMRGDGGVEDFNKGKLGIALSFRELNYAGQDERERRIVAGGFFPFRALPSQPQELYRKWRATAA